MFYNNIICCSILAYVVQLTVIIVLLLGTTNSKSLDNNIPGVTFQNDTSSDSKQECPVWFKRNHDGSCECGETIPPSQLSCNSKTNVTFISRTFCVTYDDVNDTVYAGYCPYNFLIPDADKSWLSALPPLRNFSQLNELMCGPLNRTGPLCGKCQEGLGPAVLSYSNKCVKCFDSHYGWLVYLSAALLPTTLLCLIVIVFHVEATSPAMNSFILMCQLIVNLISIESSLFLVSPNEMYKWLSFIVISFYGMWNLDFFRSVLPPFCISSDMNTLQVVALDYVVALYPLILTAVVYYCIEFHDKGYRVFVFLWKPFHRHFVRFKRTWNLKGSVINAFATFVLLSYCKLLFISYGLLHQVTVRGSDGVTLSNWVMYFDASLTVFHSAHIPYALLAITVLIFLILLPLLFILFFQNRFFRRCLSVCRLEITLLTELATICQRSYKNGINGSSDYRWFAGVYLSYRIAYSLYFPLNPPNFFLLVIFTSGVTSLACAILQPHQTRLFSILDSIFFGTICYTMVYISFARFAPELNMSVIPICIAFLLPLVYFICIVTYKLIFVTKSMKCCQLVVQKVMSFCKKRPSGQNVDEEVLPYRFSNPSEYTPLLPPVSEPITVTSINVDIDDMQIDRPDK